MNQVKYHPFLNQDQVFQEAATLEMVITAYRPISKDKVLAGKTLTQIGNRYDKTVAQIALRWLVSQGAFAIPRSTQASHAQGRGQ